MEHAADTAEAAAVDHYFSSSTDNIFVPVFLRTPGRLMIVLRCASVFTRGRNNDSVTVTPLLTV